MANQLINNESINEMANGCNNVMKENNEEMKMKSYQCQ
jgi:hypothetical protein